MTRLIDAVNNAKGDLNTEGNKWSCNNLCCTIKRRV